MVNRSFVTVVTWVVCCCAVWAGEDKGLAAHWDFNEGKGDVLHDKSGNGNHGKIYYAKWVKAGSGCALQFNGADAGVDCGNGPSLDITGTSVAEYPVGSPITLEAWVWPANWSTTETGMVGKHYETYALTYTSGSCWWYISHGSNQLSAPIDTGVWQHLVGTFDGKVSKLYINGRLVAHRESKYGAVRSGKGFLMGCFLSDPTPQDIMSPATAHFQGKIDEVRVYRRALSEKEVVRHYNVEAPNKGRDVVDISTAGRFKLTPRFSTDAAGLAVGVNVLGLLPLPRGARIHVELAHAGDGKALQTRRIEMLVEPWRADVSFALNDLVQGDYEIRATLKDDTGIRSVEKLVISYPPHVVKVASPDERVVAPLPRPPEPASFEFEMDEGGGFRIIFMGGTYPVESSYSYPHGGMNALIASPKSNTHGEKSWTVSTEKIGEKEYRARAGAILCA